MSSTNPVVQLLTDYILYSPFTAQLQNSSGLPFPGCANWNDASKLDSSVCAAFVGLICNPGINQLPFAGMTRLDSATSFQFVAGTESDLPFGSSTLLYSDTQQSVSHSYAIVNMDGEYICGNAPVSVYPAPLHINQDSSQIPQNQIIFNPCDPNSGQNNQDQIWNLSNFCTLPTSVASEGWIVVPFPSSLQMPNQGVKLGDLVRFFNVPNQLYLTVQDLTWGGGSYPTYPSNVVVGQTATSLAQPQLILSLTSSVSPSTIDGSVFQILPTSGLLPQSYVSVSSFTPSPFSLSSCPCPLTQCQSGLCNVPNSLLFQDVQGGQLCPINCTFNPLTSSCNFQIDPGVCALCKSWQCGDCPDGQTCARDLNSGQCRCVPLIQTQQQTNNRLFWIYLISGLMIGTFLIGGGIILWIYFSKRSSSIQSKPKKQKSKDQTFGSAIFSIVNK